MLPTKENMKALQARYELTNAEFASIAGVTPSMVAKWSCGIKDPGTMSAGAWYMILHRLQEFESLEAYVKHLEANQ